MTAPDDLVAAVHPEFADQVRLVNAGVQSPTNPEQIVLLDLTNKMLRLFAALAARDAERDAAIRDLAEANLLIGCDGESQSCSQCDAMRKHAKVIAIARGGASWMERGIAATNCADWRHDHNGEHEPGCLCADRTPDEARASGEATG